MATVDDTTKREISLASVLMLPPEATEVAVDEPPEAGNTVEAKPRSDE